MIILELCVYHAQLNVVLVLVIPIVIHVKVDIFWIQEIVLDALIIVKQLIVIVVNVQVVMMDIIYIDINAKIAIQTVQHALE